MAAKKKIRAQDLIEETIFRLGDQPLSEGECAFHESGTQRERHSAQTLVQKPTHPKKYQTDWEGICAAEAHNRLVRLRRPPRFRLRAQPARLAMGPSHLKRWAKQAANGPPKAAMAIAPHTHTHELDARYLPGRKPRSPLEPNNATPHEQTPPNTHMRPCMPESTARAHRLALLAQFWNLLRPLSSPRRSP